MARKGPAPRAQVDRFAEKIALAPSGCIEWIAPLSDQGYGYLRLGVAAGGGHVYAHRWSYEYHFGPIPSGLHIDHLCRNRACVNPDHLEAVPPRTNSLRGFGSPAVNSRKSHCHNGHRLSGPNLYTTDSYAGRAVELFCDPDVQFGGKSVGGTRVSRLSHIDATKKVPLLIKKGQTAMYGVDPLPRADILRAEWRTATPERRAAIEAEVATLTAADESGDGA